MALVEPALQVAQGHGDIAMGRGQCRWMNAQSLLDVIDGQIAAADLVSNQSQKVQGADVVGIVACKIWR